MQAPMNEYYTDEEYQYALKPNVSNDGKKPNYYGSKVSNISKK